MKNLGVTLFAFVLWFSLSAFAQDAGGQQSGASDQSSMGQKTTKKTKLQHLTGKISDDGKSITTADNKTYTISNPDAVKGHEGHDVRVSGHLAPGDNATIHVTSVKMVAKKMKGGAMSEKPPH